MARTSNDTILTFKNDEDNMSDWSVMWSTTQIPGMDRATGAGRSRRRKSGRRRLRLGALILGCFLTMHVRVSAAALTGGYFVFLMLLLLTVAVVANPLRHFEVYLGQWSLNGPGRAFRIIPMFDGIGVAICIHAILRAIISVVLAAIAVIYVMHSTSDRRLPFTYCRDMNLKPYEGSEHFIDTLKTPNRLIDEDVFKEDTIYEYRRSKHILRSHFRTQLKNNPNQVRRKTSICNETYPDNFPPIFRTPSYNFFYVEVMHYRPDHKLSEINLHLLYSIMAVWVVLWILMIIEKCTHGRLIWNNMCQGLVVVPCLWASLLIFCGAKGFFAREKPLRNVFHIGGHKEILEFLTDSFVVATYIHSSALGSELIHGKGLNHYASGHIDPLLDGENIWHSAILLIMTALTTGGASFCALTDYMHMRDVSNMQETTLWVYPLIAKCALGGEYGHLTSTLLFSGLMFAYMTVAFVCIKTALHTIFEYKVKLVFIEQTVVVILMLLCMAISVIFTTNAGLGLIEGIDVFLAGIATPLICALEMMGLLFVYRSHDFMSDMQISMEENACSSRIGIQWQIVPFLEIVLFILEAIMIANSELPGLFIGIGVGTAVIILLALPFRACHNAYHFMQPPKSRN